MTGVTIRRGRADDAADVAAFTEDTWGDRSGDYISRVFPEWVESDGPDQRTLVADADGTVVGVCQARVLSEHEGWMQGMRVHPDYRGRGVSTRLNSAGFDWLAEQGCVVARNMVFSWNAAGLGGSRAAGFDPETEFRWAEPDPDPAADLGGATGPVAENGVDEATADAAWNFWRASDARTHLRGLALDAEESWALSELTRERLREAAADGRLQVVRDDGVAGVSLRNRTYDREGEDGETTTWAEYAVGAWASPAACERLLAAVARDAAAVGADETRVLIPETVEAVTDVAAAGAAFSEEPDFVLAADLTGEYP